MQGQSIEIILSARSKMFQHNIDPTVVPSISHLLQVLGTYEFVLVRDKLISPLGLPHASRQNYCAMGEYFRRLATHIVLPYLF